MSASEQIYLIAMGGNMPSKAGSPRETLSKSLNDIRNLCGKIEAVSRFFETPCFPAGAGPDYVNAAAKLRSRLSPLQLLAALHRIEESFERTRETRWGMRTLDLDLIGAGSAILPDLETFQHWQDLPAEAQKKCTPPELILPHPRLAERAFVLVPLADIAPEWIHPVTQRSVAQMLSDLPAAEKAGVVALED